MILTGWTTFTAIAGIISFFSSGVGAFVLQMAVGIGLNYAARALAGKPKQQGFSVQGKIQAGADISRSFLFGRASTAGSLVYANTWGQLDNSPNAYLVQVIAVSDMPIQSLEEIFIGGEKVTLNGTPHSDYGYPVNEYRKNGKDYQWIKFYDGSQIAADPYLVEKFYLDADRPYTASRVGKGVAYIIATSLVNDKLFSGFPSFKFSFVGMKLYDPSKDSTNGGSGTQRWNNPATWGGDGDHLPAVQIYNICRGIYLNGQWQYGLQNINTSRLPTENWIAQIDKCRALITGPGGNEAMYRSGGEINVGVQIANGIESILTACQGRLSEIGGFYKMRCGAPGSPDFSFTDDDILSTEEQSFTPFFGLADSINGITAKYPEPAEGWAVKVAPPIYRSDLEERDSNRRLLADVSFDCVPYSAQVSRLMKSALEEAQRARRHTASFPPAFWIVEPGDVGIWNSARNGYIDKLFRVDGAMDKSNLDVSLDITEVDNSDFDWDVETDYTQPVIVPVVPVRPLPQPIYDFAVQPATVEDEHSVARRPAIRLLWKDDVDDIIGVQFSVRIAATGEVIFRGIVDDVSAGADGALISGNAILPDTPYEVQAKYVPGSYRETEWSDWLAVTTPDVRLSAEDLIAALAARVTSEFAAAEARFRETISRIDEVLSDIASRGVIGDTDLRGQSWSHRIDLINRIQSVTGGATATIQEVWTVATNTQTSLASLTTSVTAQLAGHQASIDQYAIAIAELDGYVGAAWGVKLTVDGYVSGVQLINGGSGTSAFIISADVFQIAWPGITGGAAVPVFQISNVSGSAKLAFRGDMFADGTFTARMIQAAAITGDKIAANTIETNNLIVNSATKVASATHPDGNVSPAIQSNIPFISLTTYTKSNSISIQWSAAIYSNTVNTTGGGTPAEYNFRVKVDGALIKEFKFWESPFAITNTSPYTWVSAIGIPFTLECVAEGLSVGFHTFTIEYYHAFNNQYYSGIKAGRMTIKDLFR